MKYIIILLLFSVNVFGQKEPDHKKQIKYRETIDLSQFNIICGTSMAGPHKGCKHDKLQKELQKEFTEDTIYGTPYPNGSDFVKIPVLDSSSKIYHYYNDIEFKLISPDSLRDQLTCNHIWVKEYEDGILGYTVGLVCVKCYKKKRTSESLVIDTTKFATKSYDSSYVGVGGLRKSDTFELPKWRDTSRANIPYEFEGEQYYIEYRYNSGYFFIPAIKIISSDGKDVEPPRHYLQAIITVNKSEKGADGVWHQIPIGDRITDGTFVPPGGGCFEDNPVIWIKKAIKAEEKKKPNRS